ncbi:helix-turn-helix domain-containing protein [Streptomyces subrutilus]|uniref:helix-turn-helix domain-containing protein n=1 Tax=Streptomyces subrutilus TaxID=36818 RepID=UPI0033EF2A38
MRHADHYTVVGNHLAQHRVLSLVALGLALHIQSLPAGAGVGIKRLCERFPEGEVWIAAGLRELEAHGYLERSRVRLPSGQVVTRTVSYNRPSTVPVVPATPSTAPPDPSPAAPPAVLPAPPPPESPDAVVAVPAPVPVPVPVPVAPVPAVADGPVRPEPGTGGRWWREAVALLARLRGDDPRLLLAERHVRELAPGVAAWLERGAEPDAVRMLLAAGLPADLRHPAGLIAHRLRTQTPPRLPPAPAAGVRVVRCVWCGCGALAPRLWSGCAPVVKKGSEGCSAGVTGA